MKVAGQDVYTAIGVDRAQQIISTGPNQGQPYYRARYDGKGFIVTEEFFKDWSAGNIVEVNLSESTYEVDDPMNPGEKISRQSWQLVAYGTIDQIERVLMAENRLNKVRKQGSIELQKLEVEALGSVKLSDDMIKQLKAAL
jgi:hypothetical protein